MNNQIEKLRLNSALLFMQNLFQLYLSSIIFNFLSVFTAPSQEQFKNKSRVSAVKIYVLLDSISNTFLNGWVHIYGTAFSTMDHNVQQK